MNITKLQTEVADWARKNFPDAKPYQPLLGVGEETGELMHAHLKAEQGIRVNEDHHGAKMDAVGDIIIFLAHYCELNLIDMNAAVATTWEKVKLRDWQKNKTDGGAV